MSRQERAMLIAVIALSAAWLTVGLLLLAVAP